jgi:thiamine pyrophosphate-dependent acetolactate synthase large subunit-like protein
VSFLVREAIALALEAFPPDACFVCANGYISRETFNIRDREQNFYMVGSMGLAASIALGAALAQPERPLVVLDGDGNVLMGLGPLAVIGTHKPRNLHHICLDNGVYASTGNQRSIAREVSLEGIAREAGYVRTARATTPEEASAELKAMLGGDGPTFLRILVDPEPHPREFDRVSHTPEEVRDRFQRALRGQM